MRTAASTLPTKLSSAWAASHPEWWGLTLSVAAWFTLLLGASRDEMPLCTSTPQSPFPDAFFDWTLMTLAMMPPLVVLSIRHVGFRSPGNRRHLAIGEFLIGYLGVWIAIGTIFLVVVSLVAAGPAFTTDRRIVTAAAYGAAILWQFTPLKRRALWRCHRIVPIAIESWHADMCCLRFGIGTGLDCLASCWLMMTVPLFAQHSAPVMACLQAAMVCERYQRSRYPRRGSSVVLLGVAYLIDVVQGLA
jgi:predicted metal-binding membrane protein